MNKALIVAALAVLCACPGPSGGDGGTGGSSGGGSSGGGSSGGGSSGGGSSGGGSAGGGSANSIPQNQLCASIATAECAYGIRCGAFSSMAGCMALLASQGGNATCANEQFAAIAAGHATYHGDQAALCVASLSTAVCSEQTGGFSGPACDATFVGMIATNGACAYDVDCVPGDFCSGTGIACGGSCQPKVGIGQPATGPNSCVEGATVFNDICFAGLAVGQDCSSNDGGSLPVPCATGLQCSQFNLTDGGLSELCTSATADAGAPCQDLANLVGGCGGFTQCVSGTCTPPVALNGPCGNETFCQFDLWCDTALAPPTCQPASAIGGPCSSDQACAGGICDGGSANFDFDAGRFLPGACVGLPGSGLSCTDACAAGFYCDFQTDTCLSVEPDGQPCIVGEQCTSGACNTRDGGSTPTCGLCE